MKNVKSRDHSMRSMSARAAKAYLEGSRERAAVPAGTRAKPARKKAAKKR